MLCSIWSGAFLVQILRRKKVMKENKKVNEEVFDDEITPLEEMAYTVTGYLARLAEISFAGLESDEVDLMNLVVRMEEVDGKTAVRMIQAAFLTGGLTYAAAELDLLRLIEKQDSDIYDKFYDALFETDTFDWYSVESMLREVREESEDGASKEVS